MTGGGPKVNRQGNDYYPTPPEVTRAFLRVEGDRLREIGGALWEPCARGGAMKRELEAAGFAVIGTDIVADPDNGVTPLDVMRANRPIAPNVVTNPPFAPAGEIILHLLARLEVRYLALLLKSQFWHAEGRRELFAAYPPARIWALTWRPDFLGGGAPTMECAWSVWERDHRGPTTYDLLAREAQQEPML